MENHLHRRSQSSAGAVLGVLLVLAGILYMAQRYLPFTISENSWPLLVILTGLVLLAVGVAVRSVSGLIIAGSITTVVGLILAVQNAFGLWAAWSYAWALVAPGAVGLGIAIKGMVDGNRRHIERGSWMAAVGLALFAIFGLFFEGALHVSGVDLGTVGNLVLPLLLVVIGLALLAGNFIKPGNRPSQTAQ
jgi:hypothetical protein